ncbi:MAG: cyclic nucleotide-binding domain-containing protein [Lysobacterales bacterium]|jgi:CRP-like cAMP-binding protein
MAIDPQRLASLYPLDSLRRDTLEHLAGEASLLRYGPGEPLFRAGEVDEDLVYLLSGAVEGQYPDGRSKRIDAESLQGRYPVGEAQPRRFTAIAGTQGAEVVRLERRATEKLLAWDQLCRHRNEQADSAEDNAWVYRLLGSRAFQKLPTGNIERMFAAFREIRVPAGENVIAEGAAPDYFYVVKQGSLSVAKTLDGQPVVVAYLVRGDCFGEDALLSNTARNATVRTLEDCRLMRLARQEFETVLKPPAVDWATVEEAAALTRAGARVVDVRLPSEFRQRALRDAINLPLATLREGAVEQLDRRRPVLVYCNTGERSAAACFILTRLGYDVRALQGGLARVTKKQPG